jgi:hypothetical protein
VAATAHAAIELLLRRMLRWGSSERYPARPRTDPAGSYSAGLARLDDLRRGAAAASGAAPRFSRAFFFRCRSFRQRTIGREPLPMREA